MRIMGFSKKWEKLSNPTFTTIRFVRKDKDWQVGELVQVVLSPRSKERDILGVAKIVNKESRDLFNVGLADYEIRADGFFNKEEMGEWLDKTYGKRWVEESMNLMRLKWVEIWVEQ